MSITTFVWYPNDQNVGHASLSISGGSYISWWPADAVGLKSGKVLSAPSTIRDDIAAEGKMPDYASAPINGLDTAKIEGWWKIQKIRSAGEQKTGMPDNLSRSYHLYLNNCSSVVIRALAVGGAIENQEFKAYLQKHLVSVSMLPQALVPNHVEDVSRILGKEERNWLEGQDAWWYEKLF